MKITKPTSETLIDRKIGLINVLDNEEILLEKTKLKNMRNGKVRS